MTIRRFIGMSLAAGFVLFAGILCSLSDLVAATRLRFVRGRASWYGEEYRGSTMSNGDLFDPDARTCASYEFPIGTVLRVRCLATGRKTLVEVTDRGPARRLRRLVDLSRRSFNEIAPLDDGVIDVEIEVIP